MLIPGIFYYEQVYWPDDIRMLLEMGYAVDGTQGGLVLGNSHDEGGIHFLINFGDRYKLLGNMEGYEYLFHVASTFLTRNNFAEFNNHDRDIENPFQEYNPPAHIRIIDARVPPGGMYKSKFILFEGRGNQGIINKHSTKKYLEWLDQLNSEYTYRYNSEDVLATTELDIIKVESGEVIWTAPLMRKDRQTP